MFPSGRAFVFSFLLFSSLALFMNIVQESVLQLSSSAGQSSSSLKISCIVQLIATASGRALAVASL